MKSRMQASAYFYEDPTERSLLEFKDVLTYENIKGNISNDVAEKLLTDAIRYLKGEI